MVLLQGEDEIPFYSTNAPYRVFIQESYFMWAFGVIEPGCYGAIDVNSGSPYLFIPRHNDNYVVYYGTRTLEEFSSKYNIRNVHFCDEMNSVLRQCYPTVLLTLCGISSDSSIPIKEATFDGIYDFYVDNTILYNIITNLRVLKTDQEVNVMKYVIDISLQSHRNVMRFVKGGNKLAYLCESEFLHYCYSVGGCRFPSRTPICASGPYSAILLYGHASAPNDQLIEPHDICLFDMGACYFGYCASATCSFPANGKFTAEQKLIYEAVLNVQSVTLKACRPGVSWADIHILSQKALLAELVHANLLIGDPDAMESVGLGAVFLPHGIGHLIGLDYYDVGGYLPDCPPRRGEPRGIDKLRTARILEERMVLTLDVGCYFIDTLLDEAMSDQVLSKFLVLDRIQTFRTFGGVRIGDVIQITADGAVNLSEKMPRTVKQIENWMAGKDDKKYNQHA